MTKEEILSRIAYDECGLTNEMNTALGYGGQFVAELPKEE